MWHPESADPKILFDTMIPLQPDAWLYMTTQTALLHSSAMVSQMEPSWTATYGCKCDGCTSLMGTDVNSNWRTNEDTLPCPSRATSVVILSHLVSRVPQTASDNGGVGGGFNDGDPLNPQNHNPISSMLHRLCEALFLECCTRFSPNMPSGLVAK